MTDRRTTLLQLDRRDGTTYINSITIITLCLLGNFSCFFVVCCFFFKINFWKNSFRNTIRVSNGLDPDPFSCFFCLLNFSKSTSFGNTISVKQFGSRSIFHDFLSPAEFFKINFFEKFFQEYHQNVKQFGSRSGLTFSRALSGSKPFAKAISRGH